MDGAGILPGRGSDIQAGQPWRHAPVKGDSRLRETRGPDAKTPAQRGHIRVFTGLTGSLSHLGVFEHRAQLLIETEQQLFELHRTVSLAGGFGGIQLGLQRW